MSKFKISLLLLTLITIITAVGCKTDIDIIAPKKDVTIVYGLLEANKTRHYIRINKSFVGEDSASALAGEPGINEYSNDEILEAKVYGLDVNGATKQTFEIKPTHIYSKEDGTFFSDSNKIYYFDGELNATYTYKLYLRIKPEGEEEKEVTAETNVLGAVGTSKLNLLTPSRASNCGERVSEVEWVDRSKNELRTESTLKWSSAENGAAYTAYLFVYYTNYYLDGTSHRDSVYIACGQANEPDEQGAVAFVINPTDIFQLIANNVPDFDALVLSKRVFGDTIQYYVDVSNEEFDLYREINQPTSTVSQERPSYTNVVNGIGLFASKYTENTMTEDFCSGRILDAATLEEVMYSNTNNSKGILSAKGFSNPRCDDSKGSCI